MKAIKRLSMCFLCLIIFTNVVYSNDSMPARYPKVLLYHHVDYYEGVHEEDQYLYVLPENFENQIKYLSDNGYTFLFPDELTLFDIEDKAVIITFDDGHLNNYVFAYPILKKYNAKATLFVYIDAIGTEWHCDEEQLKEISDSGVFSIQAHSKTHANLAKLTEEEIEYEFSHTNDVIYNITGIPVSSIAYPHGSYNDLVLNQARRYYEVGFSTWRYEKNNVHTIRREYIDNKCDLIWFEHVMAR